MVREAPNRHEKGSRKYKEMVQRGAVDADKKNLPYTFSAPVKHTSTPVVVECPHCNNITSVSKNTVMVVCVSCNKLYSVTKEVD